MKVTLPLINRSLLENLYISMLTVCKVKVHPMYYVDVALCSSSVL